jgi:NAD-dependent deacetylase
MNVLFVTGAGISANAGIATYRDNGSSWRDPNLEKKSHSTRYGNHLDELWDKMWGPMHEAMLRAAPTKAHYAIAQFGGTVATQNIDKLHELAGSENVEHLHGKMEPLCMRCKSDNIAKWNGAGAPVCINCGKNKTRPNVVLFGEILNLKQLARLHNEAAKADRVIAVGTSLNVWPAADLVLENLGKSILINKEAVPAAKYVKKFYEADADEVIDEVLESL